MAKPQEGAPGALLCFLCLHHREDRDPAKVLDFEKWEFYVVSTTVIDEELEDRKTVALLQRRLAAELDELSRSQAHAGRLEEVGEVTAPPAESAEGYRSATTGRYVTRSADRDPSKRAREIRGRFRAAGRRFSDSAEVVREDRDSAD